MKVNAPWKSAGGKCIYDNMVMVTKESLAWCVEDREKLRTKMLKRQAFLPYVPPAEFHLEPPLTTSTAGPSPLNHSDLLSQS
jgi:hypothetical protein